MRKIITVAALALLLSACGDDATTATSDNTQAVTQAKGKTIACDVLTQDYLEKAIAGASTIIKKEPTVPKSRIDQNCAYSFKLNNENYTVKLNLLAAKSPYVDEKMLDKDVSYLQGSELISGVGEKAYYSSGTVTALGNQSIVQLTAYSSASTENDKSRVIAEQVANGMLEALNK